MCLELVKASIVPSGFFGKQIYCIVMIIIVDILVRTQHQRNSLFLKN